MHQSGIHAPTRLLCLFIGGPWISVIRFTIPSTLSLALVTKNQAASKWLLKHGDRSEIIGKIMKSRETTQKNNQLSELHMFDERIKLSKNASNSGKTK